MLACAPGETLTELTQRPSYALLVYGTLTVSKGGKTLSKWKKFDNQKRPDQKTPVRRVGSYVEPNEQVGALVELQCQEESTADSELFRELLDKICRHVVERNPTYIYFTDIPEEVIEHEAANQRALTLELGKPEQIADRIAEAKAERILKSRCLMYQPYDQPTTVGGLIKEAVARIGEFLRVGGFVRYEVPEKS